jgi:hypothetical protein
LQAVEEARSTLVDAELRRIYDAQLLAGAPAARSVGGFSPPSPATAAASRSELSWQPYLCVILSVPVVLAAMVVAIVSLLRFESLTSSIMFGDQIAIVLIPASLVAFPLGFAVLIAGARRSDAVRRLRLLERKGVNVDPIALAKLKRQAEGYELTRWAIWATRISLGLMIGLWIWFGTIFRARGLY